MAPKDDYIDLNTIPDSSTEYVDLNTIPDTPSETRFINPDKGALDYARDLASGVAASPFSLASMVAKAGAQGGRLIPGTTAVTDYLNKVSKASEFAGGKVGDFVAGSEKPKDWKSDILGTALRFGGEQMLPSRIPLLALKGLTGSWGKAALGSALGIYGPSQAEEALSTAEERYGRENVTPAMKAGAIGSGLIEAGGEAIAGRYFGKLMDSLMRTAGSPVRAFGANLASEIGTEMGQSGGEAAVEKASGIRPEANPMDEALAAIGPTAVMTLLSGAGAGVGAIRGLRQDNAKADEVISAAAAHNRAAGNVSVEADPLPDTWAPQTENVVSSVIKTLGLHDPMVDAKNRGMRFEQWMAEASEMNHPLLPYMKTEVLQEYYDALPTAMKPEQAIDLTAPKPLTEPMQQLLPNVAPEPTYSTPELDEPLPVKNPPVQLDLLKPISLLPQSKLDLLNQPHLMESSRLEQFDSDVFGHVIGSGTFANEIAPAIMKGMKAEEWLTTTADPLIREAVANNDQQLLGSLLEIYDTAAQEFSDINTQNQGEILTGETPQQLPLRADSFGFMEPQVDFQFNRQTAPEEFAKMDVDKQSFLKNKTGTVEVDKGLVSTAPVSTAKILYGMNAEDAISKSIDRALEEVIQGTADPKNVSDTVASQLQSRQEHVGFEADLGKVEAVFAKVKDGTITKEQARSILLASPAQKGNIYKEQKEQKTAAPPRPPLTQKQELGNILERHPKLRKIRGKAFEELKRYASGPYVKRPVKSLTNVAKQRNLAKKYAASITEQEKAVEASRAVKLLTDELDMEIRRAQFQRSLAEKKKTQEAEDEKARKAAAERQAEIDKKEAIKTTQALLEGKIADEIMAKAEETGPISEQEILERSTLIYDLLETFSGTAGEIYSNLNDMADTTLEWFLKQIESVAGLIEDTETRLGERGVFVDRINANRTEDFLETLERVENMISEVLEKRNNAIAQAEKVWGDMRILYGLVRIAEKGGNTIPIGQLVSILEQVNENSNRALFATRQDLYRSLLRSASTSGQGYGLSPRKSGDSIRYTAALTYTDEAVILNKKFMEDVISDERESDERAQESLTDLFSAALNEQGVTAKKLWEIAVGGLAEEAAQTEEMEQRLRDGIAIQLEQAKDVFDLVDQVSYVPLSENEHAAIEVEFKEFRKMAAAEKKRGYTKAQQPKDDVNKAPVEYAEQPEPLSKEEQKIAKEVVKQEKVWAGLKDFLNRPTETKFSLTDGVTPSVDDLNEAVKGLPGKINVVTIDKIPFSVRADVMRRGFSLDQVEAFVHGGERYVVQGNISGERARQLIVTHELVHLGQTPELMEQASKIAKSLMGDISFRFRMMDIAERYHYNITTEQGFRDTVAELAAREAETLGQYRWWNQIRDWFVSKLREFGINIPITESDFRAIIKDMMSEGLKNPQNRTNYMIAWHGSPHRFDKFRSAFINSGEGSQTKGYGLYFSSEKAVAEYYREVLTRKMYGDDLSSYRPPIEEPSLSDPNSAASYAADLIDSAMYHGDPEDAYSAAIRSIKNYSTKPESFKDDVLAFISKWAAISPIPAYPAGALYKVKLAPRAEEYLLWQKPLDEQSDFVKNALGDLSTRKTFPVKSPFSFEDTYETEATGESLYQYLTEHDPYKSPKAVSAYLLSLGIRGVKYRGGSGFDNFVIFDDNDVEILTRYSLSRGPLEYTRTAKGASVISKDQSILANAVSIVRMIAGQETKVELMAPATLQAQTATIPEIAKLRKELRDLGYTEQDINTNPMLLVKGVSVLSGKSGQTAVSMDDLTNIVYLANNEKNLITLSAHSATRSVLRLMEYSTDTSITADYQKLMKMYGSQDNIATVFSDWYADRMSPIFGKQEKTFFQKVLDVFNKFKMKITGTENIFRRIASGDYALEQMRGRVADSLLEKGTDAKAVLYANARKVLAGNYKGFSDVTKAAYDDWTGAFPEIRRSAEGDLPKWKRLLMNPASLGKTYPKIQEAVEVFLHKMDTQTEIQHLFERHPDDALLADPRPHPIYDLKGDEKERFSKEWKYWDQQHTRPNEEQFKARLGRLPVEQKDKLWSTYNTLMRSFDAAYEFMGSSHTENLLNKYQKTPYGFALRKAVEDGMNVQQFTRFLQSLEFFQSPEGQVLQSDALKAFVQITPTVSRLRNKMAGKGKVAAYFPRFHGEGDYAVGIKTADDQLLYWRKVTSESEAKKLRAKLQLDPKWRGQRFFHTYAPDLPSEMFHSFNPDQIQQFIDISIADSVKNGMLTPEAAADILNNLEHKVATILKSQGFSKHFIHRQDWNNQAEAVPIIEGYDEADPAELYSRYIAGMASSLSKQEASVAFNLILQSIDAKQTPKQWEYIKKYMDFALRRGTGTERVIGRAQSLVFMWYLGGNLKSAFVQLTQNFVTGIPILARHLRAAGTGSGADAEKIYLTAWKDVMALHWKRLLHRQGVWFGFTAEERKLLELMEKDGTTDAHQIIYMSGEIESGLTSMYRKALKTFSLPFAMAEKTNRQAAALAMIRSLRRGMSAEEFSREIAKGREGSVYQKARQFTYDTHFVMGKANLPEVAMESGMGGNALRLLYTFRGFPHNYLLTMAQSLKGEGGKLETDVVMRSMMYMFLFGGAAGLPFLDDLIEILEKLFGYPVRGKLKKGMEDWIGGTATRAVLSGLPTVAGADVSGSMQIGLPFSELATGKGMASTVWGAYYGIESKFGKAWDDLKAGELYRAIENASPAAIESVMKAPREAGMLEGIGVRGGVRNQKGTALFDDQGRPYTPNAIETALQALGFRPAKTAELQGEDFRREQLTQNINRKKEQLHKQMRLATSAEERREVLTKAAQLNRSLTELGLAHSVGRVSIPDLMKEPIDKAPKKTLAYRREVE